MSRNVLRSKFGDVALTRLQDSAAGSIRSLRAELRQLAVGDVGGLRSELDELENRVAGIAAEVALLSSEIDFAFTQIAQLAQDIGVLRSRVRAAELDILAIKARVDQLEQKLAQDFLGGQEVNTPGPPTSPGTVTIPHTLGRVAKGALLLDTEIDDDLGLSLNISVWRTAALPPPTASSITVRMTTGGRPAHSLFWWVY